ncbi:MAG: aminotransferase class III-fold pyridoxal phosphate-dependent enzyme [Croceitalea sp.]|nr:aminotransferase class III-fold pyridoxal phosphate-dependent enzyme [Croceitalea sp.]
MIKELLSEEFQFDDPIIKKLDGYDNVNYLVVQGGRKCIFKTYPYSTSLYDILEAETKVLLTLQAENTGKFPKPIAFNSGDYLKKVDIKGESSICRMLTFLEGAFLGEISPSAKVYDALGDFLAKMDQKLHSIKDYVLQSRQWEWDLKAALLNTKYLGDIEDPHQRNIVRYFLKEYETHVLPIINDLRHQIIHNDANEWNILIQNDRVSGIIDFGDVTYAPLINEVAIAMTYASYDKEDNLQAACHVLRGYHKITPLIASEIKILYYLIAARLCMSVCNSAHAKKINSNNSYTSVSEIHAWSMLNYLLKIGPIAAEASFRGVIGLKTDKPELILEKIKKRHKHISPLLSISYKNPIAMECAAFQYMYDHEGHSFLDAYNNIPHVGHAHPKVVAAGQLQMQKLNTNTRYLYDLLPEYASRLTAKFPTPLNKVFFVNSGSAASDLAIRMTQMHTKKKHVMVMEHGYHGNTKTSIDISDYKFNNPKGPGQPDYILKTGLPNAYRSDLDGAQQATIAINELKAQENKIAAFIAEPIVGCGGQVPLAKDYLKNLYPAIRKQGGVCISDEVQTGFGRLGKYFWGFEMHGVVPDMVVLGKPMGNGHPIGAVVTTDGIAASFEKGVEFFSSFGGNPVSCAIGLAVLDVIEEENLQENAKEVGSYYKKLLQTLQKKYSCIGDVRGEGLFLGIEMVHDGTTKTNKKLAHFIKNGLRDRHILISTDGPDDNVLKTKPPLCFTKSNARQVVEAMEELLHLHYTH